MGYYTSETTLLILLLVASLVAIVVRWVRVPYTVALVLSGLLVGVLHLLPPMELTPHLVLTVFVPALLFEAAFHLDFEHLWDDIGRITALAIAGIFLSTLLIGLILRAAIGFPLPVALLFGAMISATDPVSVLASFKQAGVPKRLSIIVEGESLFNDGTALVLLRLLGGVVLAGRFDFSASVQQFAEVVVGGIVLGLVFGYLFSHLSHLISDHLIEITLTTILAYGVYLLADVLALSGVIAVVTAGLVVGNYGARTGMSPTTKINLVAFWEYIVFVINSLVFLLIGMQVDVPLLVHYAYSLAWAILAAVLSRAVVVYGLSFVLGRLLRPIPGRWQHVLVWGGLRGALSLAVALGLPISLPEREMLVVMTFGVVFFTIVGQGLTLEPLLRRLKLIALPGKHQEYEYRRGSLLMLQAGWEVLRDMQQHGLLSPPAWQRLNEEYRLVGQQLLAEIEALYGQDERLAEEELLAVQRACLRGEKARLQELFRQGVVSAEVYRHLMANLDRRWETLESIKGERK